VHKGTYAALLALVVLFAVPAATVRAATQMPIGFFDDPSFRWSTSTAQNLAAAAAAGATVIRTTADWAQIAPTKPANANDPTDPAYKLTDLDTLVREAARYNLRVMIDITGTPKWANGGLSENHMPKNLNDLKTFAQLLAVRYDGENPGMGSVDLWSVWNEPNLTQFLTPQFVGKKIVSPANYGKLYKAAYAGIKAGNPAAKVAIGETSAQGRDKPAVGSSATVSPGMFAQLLAKVPGLKFDAWAQHPYPTSKRAKPLEVVRYPNVTLSQLPTFEVNLKKFFHRTVPIWITEYGHETAPADPGGVTLAQQAAYAKQALGFAKADPNVQMFIWFTFRDSAGNPWQSGLEAASGAHKPSFASFASVAKPIDGTTQAVAAGVAPTVKVFVPWLSFNDPVGTVLGVTYRVYLGAAQVSVGQPTAALAPDQSISVKLTGFAPKKGQTYRVVASVNDVNGNVVAQSATLTTG
jgi:polysaccharide biosynthesis protein PslG